MDSPWKKVRKSGNFKRKVKKIDHRMLQSCGQSINHEAQTSNSFNLEANLEEATSDNIIMRTAIT